MIRKNIVYLVFGESGHYSDWRKWGICAYVDENLAKQHVVNAAAFANQIKQANCSEQVLSPYDITEKRYYGFYDDTNYSYYGSSYRSVYLFWK